VKPPSETPTLFITVVEEPEDCACGARLEPLFGWWPSGEIALLAVRDGTTGKIVKCKACNGGKPVA